LGHLALKILHRFPTEQVVLLWEWGKCALGALCGIPASLVFRVVLYIITIDVIKYPGFVAILLHHRLVTNLDGLNDIVHRITVPLGCAF
jgi:hypothetical protein